MDFTRLALEVPRESIPKVNDSSLIPEISKKYELRPPEIIDKDKYCPVDLMRWGIQFEAMIRVCIISNIFNRNINTRYCFI